METDLFISLELMIIAESKRQTSRPNAQAMLTSQNSNRTIHTSISQTSNSKPSITTHLLSRPDTSSRVPKLDPMGRPRGAALSSNALRRHWTWLPLSGRCARGRRAEGT